MISRSALALSGEVVQAGQKQEQKQKEIAMSDMTTEEMEQRIEDLQNSGMHLAARALIRELKHRRKAS